MSFLDSPETQSDQITRFKRIVIEMAALLQNRLQRYPQPAYFSIIGGSEKYMHVVEENGIDHRRAFDGFVCSE
jgi:hypothetical protein